MARYTETTEQPVQNQEESRPSGGKEAEPVAAVQTPATSEAVIQEVLKRMGIQGRITLDSAKRLIAHKIILARILVKTVEEFKGMDPLEVAALIEGLPYISGDRGLRSGWKSDRSPCHGRSIPCKF